MRPKQTRILSFMLVAVMLLLVLPVCGAEATNGEFPLPIIPVFPTLLRGDLVDDGAVDVNDAIHCLRHLLFSSKYDANQNVDFNGDGLEDVSDAVHLLRHVLFPATYKLKGTV